MPWFLIPQIFKTQLQPLKFHDANLIDEIANRMAEHIEVFEENTSMGETQSA